MSKQLSPESMRNIEAILQLRDVKEGVVVTKQHEEAVTHLFGKIYKDLGEPKMYAEISFGADGRAIAEGPGKDNIIAPQPEDN